MEQHYTNRELDNQFKEIKASLDRIETQTSRTNGRVTKLESWQNFIRGGLAIISLILLPILFMLIKIYLEHY